MLGVRTAALPASLRRTNQRTVISLLLRLGAASRADLAKAAGISQPTAGKITAELLKMGMLQETDAPDLNGREPRLGRPGQLLRLDDRYPRFVVVELGVTESRVAALPVAIRLEDQWSSQFETSTSPAALLKGLKHIASKFRAQSLWGVLVSVPGIIDEAGGKVLFCPNLHWLEGTDLAGLVRQVWNLPVLLVQEIRALAMGQLTAEPGGEDFLLVDFGQGVGGAIVLEGKLYPHPMPLSGELGHTPVAGNERQCGCGAIGCLETLASERGVLQSFAEKRQQLEEKVPKAEEAGGQTAVSESDWDALVNDIRRHGIEPWLAETLSAAGKVIAGALNVLGLHRVVVTGRLAELPGSIERLGSEVKAGAMWARFGQVECQAAPRRRSAGLVAAGLDRLILPTGKPVALPRPRQGRGVKHLSSTGKLPKSSRQPAARPGHSPNIS
jgi:predicted NBD/HSP70 family sugar kinase